MRLRVALNKDRIRRWLPVALWMVVIYALSAQSNIPRVSNNILEFLVHSAGHITEYAVLGFLLARALQIENARQRIAIAFLIAVLYACSDELHQAFVPRRDASAIDLIMDALGITLGMLKLFHKSKVAE